MSNSIALSPEQFIFAQGEDLRTTSLKVSEAFEKRHSDVLRAIEKITTQVSDSFNKRNFALIEINTEVGFGTRKDPAYEMTKDGFMIVVMSFTGEKAMAIKEWYINAFNAMQAKLFPSSQYGLKAIPPSPYISEAQAQQFKRSMEAHCKSNGATYPLLYRKVYDHFGVTSYKNIPCGKLEEAARLIGIKLVAAQKTAMPPEPFKLSFTPEELEDLVAERIKALPAPAPLEGDVMPKADKNTLSVDLNMMDGLRKITFDFKTNAYQNGRWAMWQSDGNFSIRVMDDDEFLISSQQLPKYIADSMGGMIKRDHLLSIIEAAAVRLKN